MFFKNISIINIIGVNNPNKYFMHVGILRKAIHIKHRFKCIL